MEVEKIKEMYVKYSLNKSDVYKHQHYVILTRSGIEKVMALEQIDITYEVIKCEPNFAVIKATATGRYDSVQSYGSATKGKHPDGNVSHAYLVEMSEKRAKARAVLKLCGAYKHGVYSEDESEEFKQES